jgi:nucleoside-specific outer membrane channel protein Tsx
VWGKIFAWLGMDFMLPHSILSFLNFFVDYSGDNQLRKGLVMIGIAVFWSVWRLRNKVIFYNGVVDFVNLVEEIKIAS